MTRWSDLIASALLVATAAQAQDSTRSDWLRNPAMGNYKAYAEFKLANYGAARVVWETLAEVGNGDALFNLAVLAEDGLGEPPDMRKAEALYTGAARAGNFKAQYRLGMLYAAGTLLQHDPVRARIYLSMAAEAGDKDAAERLATLAAPNAALTPFQQAELLGSQGRHPEAAKAYERLAAGGSRVAQTRLAWMFEAGEAEAQYALAVMLRTGRGQPRDLPQSLVWPERAAAQRYPAAVSALASGQAAGVR